MPRIHHYKNHVSTQDQNYLRNSRRLRARLGRRSRRKHKRRSRGSVEGILGQHDDRPAPNNHPQHSHRLIDRTTTQGFKMAKLLDQGFYYQHCIPGENEAVVKYYETSERLRVALKCGVYISRYCIQWKKFTNCYWVWVRGQRPTFVSFTKVSA